MRSLWIGILILMTASIARAHQPSDGEIHVSVGPLVYKTHEIDHGFDSAWRSGFGFVVEGDVDHNGGIEISMFYMPKIFSLKQNGMTVVESGKRMYIALGYRHWVNPKFSGALSFFSSYSMGDPETIRDDFPVQTSPKTSAYDTTEYGFEASLQYEPYRFGRFAPILDLRYAYSVTPKPGEDSNHYAGFFAIKYFVQGKDKEALD